MKIVSWNIQQGGGRRLDAIIAALKAWAPDVVVLQEVRQSSLAALAGIGLPHWFYPETQSASENAPYIASRFDLDAGDFMPMRAGLCHVLEAETNGITILPAHFPQKAAQIPLFEAIQTDSPSLLSLPSLLIGDLNCGIPFQDSSEKTFVNHRRFSELLNAGWIDLYRQRFGDEARDFSWISPRTGRGFRYDHALASPSFATTVTGVQYDHSVREQRLSDHSAMLIETAD